MIAITKTPHLIERQLERGLTDEVLEFILQYGQAKQAGRRAYYCVRERSLPGSVFGCKIVRIARRWVVVTGHHDRFIITAFPCKDPIRRIQKIIERFQSRCKALRSSLALT